MKKPKQTKSRIDIGQKIRAARLDRSISQKDLSLMLQHRGFGIFPANLCRIEQGKYDPTFSTVDAVADLLDLHVADLARYDEPAPRARARTFGGNRNPR
jgi:transcriptional regulator with XRE-family HTH domain